MRQHQWETFKKAAAFQPLAQTPVALIADSPWIPGYLGIGHLDYYLNADTWFEANRKILEEFPDVIFFPSWWIEYGMAIEPSAVGCRILFWPDQPPSEQVSLFRLEDVDRLKPVNPNTDGMMALALHRYRTGKSRIFDAGYIIPAVAARGPLCLAGFLRGIDELMLDMVDDPAGVHRLLKFTTETVIAWLAAQAEAIGTGVEGILVLDDIVGFLSKPLYLEFAHPYLKQICDAFPKDWVKVYHNDARIKSFLEDLPDTGFNVLNWSHSIDAAELRARTGGRLCLMGNVNPLALGVHGTPEQVKAAALDVLRKFDGPGLILSMGGGLSPGTPQSSLQALVDAAREFSAPSGRKPL